MKMMRMDDNWNKIITAVNDTKGKIINNIVDEIQHCQLFLACNPKPVVLRMLNIIIITMFSLKIPSIIDILLFTC